MIPFCKEKSQKLAHFGAQFLHNYDKDKELNFAVDLAKLDQRGKSILYATCTIYNTLSKIIEFYFWQSIIREVKKNGRRGVSGGGNVGYVRLDVNKATNNRPNALIMNFPLQAS